MVGFSKLGSVSDRKKPEHPFITEDHENFGGQIIHKVEVNLSIESSLTRCLELRHQATSTRLAKPERLHVLFPYRRMQVFENGTVLADMKREHKANCDRDEYHLPITRKLIIDGFWSPRKFKDRDGNLQTRWTLVAARWEYTPDGSTEPVVEGTMPTCSNIEIMEDLKDVIEEFGE